MKALKKLLKVAVVLVLLGAAGWAGWSWYQSRESETTGQQTALTPVTIGTGSLTQAVTGTGSIVITETADVTVDYPVTVTRLLVRAGESVAAGEPVAEIDREALKATILTLGEEIASLDSSIASLAAAYTGESSIRASAAGRVKQLFVQKGDMTSTVMAEYGGLMVLSGDGKMKVTIATDALSLDDHPTVQEGNYRYTGTVASVADGQATITFTDMRTLPGAEVTVLSGSAVLGKGKATINTPFIVSTTVDGYVSHVSAQLNSQVSRNGVLLQVTHIPADTQYDTAMQQREAKLAALAEAREALVSGYVYAEAGGIVSAVATRGTTLEAGSVIASVYVGEAMQMTISVDELDIINVALGQRATIAMDAVEDHAYEAKVSYISQIGSPSSGVTSYSVTLDVSGDEKLKIGMNGTATIIVSQVNNAVLAPLSAVSTGRNGSYVWRYDGSETGEQVYITTGLSDADYVEVKSGLSAGDVVLVTRTAAGSNASGGVNLSGVMESFGGSMPGGNGFTMPSGGGNGGSGGQTNRQNRQPGSGGAGGSGSGR